MGATTTVTAAAGVTGIRAWMGAKGFGWMTPRRMRFATVSMVVAAVVGSSVGLSGT